MAETVFLTALLLLPLVFLLRFLGCDVPRGGLAPPIVTLDEVGVGGPCPDPALIDPPPSQTVRFSVLFPPGAGTRFEVTFSVFDGTLPSGAPALGLVFRVASDTADPTFTDPRGLGRVRFRGDGCVAEGAYRSVSCRVRPLDGGPELFGECPGTSTLDATGTRLRFAAEPGETELTSIFCFE